MAPGLLHFARDQIAREGPLGGTREVLNRVKLGVMGQFGFLRPGAPIYEMDWDLLIILDACRTDLLLEVADQYSFIESVGTFESQGSTSEEWLRNNFRPEYREEMAETIHVTGNVYSETLLDPNRFRVLDEVWRSNWDDEIGTVHPRAITDRVIAHTRGLDPARIIAHYMQPHYPFVPFPDLAPGMRSEEGTHNIWNMIRRGEADRDEVWNAYRANLEYVLGDVELLLQNVDAETAIITADHGNAIGEMTVYGHPEGVPLKCLRVVPWVETSASDQGAHRPDISESGGPTSTEEKLESLGYLD